MRAQTQLDDTRDELRRKVAEHQRAVDDLWAKYTLLEVRAAYTFTPLRPLIAG